MSYIEIAARSHQNEMLREAAQERFARTARPSDPEHDARHGRLVAVIGALLVVVVVVALI